MSRSTEMEGVLRRSSRLRAGIRCCVLAAAAVVLAVGMMLFDGVQVQSQEELSNVEFGMPLNWITQDQALTPPPPYRTSFISPGDNPITVQVLPLAGDVVLILTLMACCWLLLRVASRRRN